jgi:hypothetical protein
MICSNKACIHGGKMQPKQNFYRRPANATGYSYECKDCMRARAKIKADEKKKERHWLDNLVFGEKTPGCVQLDETSRLMDELRKSEIF